MSTGPKLRANPLGARPPTTSSSAATLERLEKLQDWTEEPARAVAKSLEDHQGSASPEQPPEPSEAPQSAKKAHSLPWEDAPEGSYRQLNVRIPARLAMQLKWLGDTTFDTSMSKIVTESLQKTAKKMLADRGLK